MADRAEHGGNLAKNVEALGSLVANKLPLKADSALTMDELEALMAAKFSDDRISMQELYAAESMAWSPSTMCTLDTVTVARVVGRCTKLRRLFGGIAPDEAEGRLPPLRSPAELTENVTALVAWPPSRRGRQAARSLRPRWTTAGAALPKEGS